MARFTLAGSMSLRTLTLVAWTFLYVAFLGCTCTEHRVEAPSDQGCPPGTGIDTIIELTPGLGGIILTPGELVFQIDIMHSHHAFLWREFRELSGHESNAYVAIEVEIDRQGNVVGTRVLSSGYRQESRYVKSVVDTWQYKGDCLHGKLRLFFNEAASSVTFDGSGLRPVESYNVCTIRRGLLYHVK